MSSEDTTDQWDSTTDIDCKSNGKLKQNFDKSLNNNVSVPSNTKEKDNKNKVKKENYVNHDLSMIKSCNTNLNINNESETSSESPSSSSLTNTKRYNTNKGKKSSAQMMKNDEMTKSGGNNMINANKGILKSEIKSSNNQMTDTDKDQSSPSYQSWVIKNIKGNNKNIDLPGRVSFSTNDVYEIVDYSDGDYEDTDKSLSDSPKMVPPPRPSSATSALNNIHNHRDLYSGVTSTVTENYLHGIIGRDELDDIEGDTDETLTDIESKCCNSSRCSVMYDSNLAKARMETKAREEANKIVEEYKKELHELRTIHLQNPYSTPKAREDLGDYFSDSPYKTESPSSNSSTSKTSLSMNNELMGKRMTGSIFDEIKTHRSLDPKNDDLTSNDSPIPKDDSSNKVLPERLNNVWEKENTMKTNTTFSIKHSNSIDSTTNTGTTHNNVTFKNYLKNKNTTEMDNRLSKQMKKLNDLTSTSNSIKKKTKDLKTKSTSNRIKSAPIQSSSKIRKTKSVPTLREDRGIDEFEIDKVVSWMSIHDSDGFSDTGSLLGGTTNPSHHAIPETKPMNIRSNAWQKGRSEDEGNYSTEDGLDTDSPYEEIVSVIKEIEHEKGNKGMNFDV